MENESVSAGNTLSFGAYSWRKLTVENDRILLISDNIIEHRSFHDEKTKAGWGDCSLRQYLNTDFISDTFSAVEQERILTTNVADVDSNKVLAAIRQSEDGIMNPIIPKVTYTEDRVFLLSVDEVKVLFSENSDRAAYSNEDASWWWLRSPGLFTGTIAAVAADGATYSRGYDVDNAAGGVRPALWISI